MKCRPIVELNLIELQGKYLKYFHLKIIVNDKNKFGTEVTTS